MKKFVVGLLVMGLTSPVFAQVTELPEIEITAVNYKYLDAVDTEDTDRNVKMLEETVAMYDLKNSELYSDEYDEYEVTFYIPDGRIVAAYNKDGKIIRTIEKFKNVKLPKAVRESVFKRFPEWTLAKDVYRVTYHKDKAKKVYKVVLENGDKTMRVKTDEIGDFM
jgi:hypothetical protein